MNVFYEEQGLVFSAKYSRKQSPHCSLHGEMAERPLASDLRKFYELLRDKDRFTRRALQTVTTCVHLIYMLRSCCLPVTKEGLLKEVAFGVNTEGVVHYD